MQEDSEVTEEAPSPGVKALEEQEGTQTLLSQYHQLGRIEMLQHEILAHEREGGNPTEAKRLMQELDNVKAGTATQEDAVQVYEDYRRYNRSGPQRAASPQPAAGQGTRTAPSQAARPAAPPTAASEKADDAFLERYGMHQESDHERADKILKSRGIRNRDR